MSPQNINTTKTYSVEAKKSSKGTLNRRDYGSDRNRFDIVLLGREPML